MSQALKQYRLDRKMTQEALAEKLGVTSISVSRWETGERKISKDLLPKISEATGIAPTELRPDLADLMKVGER